MSWQLTTWPTQGKSHLEAQKWPQNSEEPEFPSGATHPSSMLGAFAKFAVTNFHSSLIGLLRLWECVDCGMIKVHQIEQDNTATVIN